MKELINNKLKPITYSASEYLNPLENHVEAKEDEKEVGRIVEGRKVRQAAATIGLAISMGAVGIALDKEERAIAAEAITSKPTLTNLSQNKKGITSSLTSGKLTVKSSANQTNSTANTNPVLIHKIEPGETIVSISRQYQLDPEAIATYNDLTDDRKLKPGQMLKIPVNGGIVNHSNAEDSSIAPNLKKLKNKQKGLQKSLAKLQSLQSSKNAKQPILLTRSEQKDIDNSSIEMEESVKGKIIYKVQEGDTLGAIAIRYGVSITQLVKENKITNPNSIQIDRELVITLGQSELKTSNRSRYLSQPSPIAQNNAIVSTTSVLKFQQEDRDLDTSKKDLAPISNKLDLQRDKKDTDRVNPYVEKLRADIQKLREYKTPQTTKQPKLTANIQPTPSKNPVSVSERLSNPEWLKQRLQRQNQRDITSRLRSQTENKRTAQLPSIDSLRNSRTSSLTKPEPQLVSSLDTDRINPNNSALSLGDRTTPDLPPLSTVEQYLPDNVKLSNKVETNTIAANVRGFGWPSRGIVTSGYGWRWGKLHAGIDIAGPVGTPILAAAPGQVIYAGWNSGGYGNLVKIRHYNGSVTLYAHNSSIVVRRGQSVARGQMIARMGSTGFSTGPHLHFEIRPRGRGAVNPIAYLPRKR